MPKDAIHDDDYVPSPRKIEWVARDGNACDAFVFDDRADFLHGGALALDAMLIDACVLSIDPTEREPAERVRVVAFTYGRWKEPFHRKTVWLFPLDVKRDWYVIDERVVGQPSQMLHFLTRHLVAQRRER